MSCVAAVREPEGETTRESAPVRLKAFQAASRTHRICSTCRRCRRRLETRPGPAGMEQGLRLHASMYQHRTASSASCLRCAACVARPLHQRSAITMSLFACKAHRAGGWGKGVPFLDIGTLGDGAVGGNHTAGRGCTCRRAGGRLQPPLQRLAGAWL